jgi:diguanylate cyclase (GGDEF)-like protein
MAPNTATSDVARIGAMTERAGWGGIRTPLASVGGLVTGGFGLLVLILACVTVGAGWQVETHQADLADLEHHSTTASLLQNVEAEAGISGLLLQRYVDAGNDSYVQEINDHANAAQQSLEQALVRGGPPELSQLTPTGAQLVQDAARATALRQAGDTTDASALLEQIVPVFRQYRLQLEAVANQEVAQVDQLRARADAAGQRAFWLLIASGTIGVVLGLAASFWIARTIMKPLSSLEETAHRASVGDLSARAPVTGPKELAHLGYVMNNMMGAIEARTADLRRANNQLRSNNLDLLEARNQAATDPLTGLGNHRSFHKSLRDEVTQAEAAGSSVGLIMIDVDGFKGINDSLGHLAGDQLLRDLANTLTQVARKENTFRYGGDELAVLLLDVNCVAAVEVAERLRTAVSEMGEQAMTISLGVGCFPEMASSAEELIYRADMAMYWAKSSGRNRVANWNDLQGAEVNRARPSYTDGLGERHDIVASLCAALEAKDTKTREHAERCSWYIAELATELGLNEADVSRLLDALRSSARRALPAN